MPQHSLTERAIETDARNKHTLFLLFFIIFTYLQLPWSNSTPNPPRSWHHVHGWHCDQLPYDLRQPQRRGGLSSGEDRPALPAGLVPHRRCGCDSLRPPAGQPGCKWPCLGRTWGESAAPFFFFFFSKGIELLSVWRGFICWSGFDIRHRVRIDDKTVCI